MKLYELDSFHYKKSWKHYTKEEAELKTPRDTKKNFYEEILEEKKQKKLSVSITINFIDVEYLLYMLDKNGQKNVQEIYVKKKLNTESQTIINEERKKLQENNSKITLNQTKLLEKINLLSLSTTNDENKITITEENLSLKAEIESLKIQQNSINETILKSNKDIEMNNEAILNLEQLQEYPLDLQFKTLFHDCPLKPIYSKKEKICSIRKNIIFQEDIQHITNKTLWFGCKKCDFELCLNCFKFNTILQHINYQNKSTDDIKNLRTKEFILKMNDFYNLQKVKIIDEKQKKKKNDDFLLDKQKQEDYDFKEEEYIRLRIIGLKKILSDKTKDKEKKQ